MTPKQIETLLGRIGSSPTAEEKLAEYLHSLEKRIQQLENLQEKWGED